VASKALGNWTIRGVIRRGTPAAALAVATLVSGSALQAAPHSAEVTLVAGKTGGGLDFNGYQRGAMTVTIPVGWQVVVHFQNAGTLAHSLAVLPSGAHNQVSPAATPAFPGATTSNFAAGLPKGAEQSFTFDASKSGTYEFVCGVPGHAVTGQWVALAISDSADSPSVTPAGAATIAVK